jgi:hypothetical protein
MMHRACALSDCLASSLSRTAELTRELDFLEQYELHSFAAQVKLIRGAWLLCDFTRQEEGKKLVQEALADRQHLLSKADVAFAEAKVAESIGGP